MVVGLYRLQVEVNVSTYKNYTFSPQSISHLGVRPRL